MASTGTSTRMFARHGSLAGTRSNRIVLLESIISRASVPTRVPHPLSRHVHSPPSLSIHARSRQLHLSPLIRDGVVAPKTTIRQREFHDESPKKGNAATATAEVVQPEQPEEKNQQSSAQPPPFTPLDSSSNPALSFPCLDQQEARSASLLSKNGGSSSRNGNEATTPARTTSTSNASSSSISSGPEPSYTTGKHQNWRSKEPLLLDWGGILPEYNVAYETWGTINADSSNVILLHTGLSASSHAHSTAENPKPGWWEKFIGPGGALDTDKYFIVCTNVIGGCYGSTGPGSADPADGRTYATRFPILTMQDMVRAQFRLLEDVFGVGEVKGDGRSSSQLYASVGASMGGMQSLAAGVLFPDRVNKIVSISGCARSHPYSIAMRHTQRQVLMMDPNWRRGFYYDSGVPPHAGMKLAREIATVTYRSGPEWEQRFGRRRADPNKPPALCPDFLIETYLDHAGEKFCLEYDANSLLYVSKAMDLFDLGLENQSRMAALRKKHEDARAVAAAASPSASTTGSGVKGNAGNAQHNDETAQQCGLSIPSTPYVEQEPLPSAQSLSEPIPSPSSSSSNRPPEDLIAGLSPLRHIPTLVLGVASDSLFPAWQQREIAETLRAAGNRSVTHVELGEDTSLFGHDTFLLDLEHIGGSVRSFLG